METDTSLTAKPVCSNSCPACCLENVEEINARTDQQIRTGSLWLSSVLAVIFLSAHIYFSFIDKALHTPDVLWALILAPWGGAAMSKISALLSKKK